jgi:hypothetical protein
MWTALTAAVLVTYSWVDPAETYHVSRDGLAGGLSRAITFLNFPVALVAIALILVAMAVLPAVAWCAAVPAVAMCATIPLFTEQSNLDAHWGNAIPALGVLIALSLTVAAVRRAGASLAPGRPWDGWRIGLTAVVVLVSLPWITAELGFHFPGDFFMGEELGPERDGTMIAAVHLGHHHGTDGAVLLVTAILLSRIAIRPIRLRVATFAYLGLMLSYGGVNFVQDAWNEQLFKRGSTDLSIPSALLPGMTPIWGVILALGVLATVVLLREDKSYSAT